MAPIEHDTIHALATAAGKAGIAIVRISGTNAGAVLESLTHLPAPPPRKFSVRHLYKAVDDQESDRLDEAVVVFIPGPNSFTGEDCAEIHAHGGLAILQALLEFIENTGLSRLAGPGEFTRRAFENERIDLTKAEAIADLVDAETEPQRRQALLQYEGAARSELSEWRALLIDAMASLEAEIDFPDEEDVPDAISSRAKNIVSALLERIDHALADADRSLAIKEGFKIAIIGKPNAGKSSLLNAITKRDTAIVSDIPGTTRDAIEARLVLGGHIVWFVDTAGLRNADDAIEAEGVKRAKQHAKQADMRLMVVSADDENIGLELVRDQDVVVFNKTDLRTTPSRMTDNSELDRFSVFETQAHLGIGVEEILEHLKNHISKYLAEGVSSIVTRERHRTHLKTAREHIERGRTAMLSGHGAELASEDLRLAARELGAVSGDVDVEDLLDKIFAEFCIGK